MELHVHTGQPRTDEMLTAALTLWESTIPILRTAGAVVVTSADLLAEATPPEADLYIVCCRGEERPVSPANGVWVPMPVSLPQLEKALAEYTPAVPQPEIAAVDSSAETAAPALTLSPEEWLVGLGKDTVRLTETEFALLEILYAHRGQIVSKETLRNALWPEGVAGNVCEVHMTHLRKKLSSLLGEGALVGVRGKGYILH